MNHLKTALTLSVLLVLSAPLTLHAEPYSIEEFMAMQEKWSVFVKNSPTFHLEGRYGVIGKNSMVFTGCPLQFHFPPNTTFTAGSARNMEVSGRLMQDGKTTYFQIDKIEVRLNDAERLHKFQAELDHRKPEEWYSLADWAIGRAKFYNDSSLREEGMSLRKSGIEIERGELPSDATEKLLALADKAVNLQLPTEFAREMRHCAYRNQYAAMQRTGKKDWDSFVALLKEQLAGGKKFLLAVDADLQMKYTADAIKVYAEASSDVRTELERYFVIEIERLRIERDAKPDGSNGTQIAARLEGFLPEYASLAEEYRQKEMDYRVSRVTTLTRQEMLDLCKVFEDRKEPDRVLEVKRNWLKAREPGMRRDRGRGLCDLAEDWVTLVGDKDTATALYIDAYKADPGYPPSTIWLSNNGYVLHRGEWMTKEEVPTSARDEEMASAIREGRIIIGMTAEQVRAAMGVKPSSRLVFPTSRGLTELISFADAGLTVRLFRRTHLEQLTVVSITPTTAKALPASKDR